ncbi:FCS-Like Zinc finger 17-like [Telopea speciosissima]|uniref:FCS-Like Zinc finger 17-like n=1 Tax=Telopea speciosissima TaxID=54955 RepID=UPI001CC61469|nr:FCS-Like Zinc finger 17-like [Telopea speciosissima]
MSSAYPTGLRILIERSRGEPNIVCKSTMTWRKRRPITAGAQRAVSFNSGEIEFKSLKTCHLCQKRLSPNKDVFMYRGDQGFCSVECRSRQIFLDDMREIEASTNAMLSSSSSSPCRSSRRVRDSGWRRLS